MSDQAVTVAAEIDVGIKPFVWLLGITAAVVLLLAPTFLSMVDIWNRDSTFTHGYTIPLLSAWLIWRDRVVLSRVEIKPEPRVFILIAGLLIVWLAADLSGVQVARQGAAVALVVASVWCVLGNSFARRAMFPLGYLFFAVPFGDFLVPYLIDFTTHFTVAAVEAVGVPIYREGTQFSLPSGNFEVVKACSGVRYLIATVALGVLFCALSYSTWRRRLAFMALCLTLPIVANGVRAFGIVMIAHYSELRYAVGIDHLIYGWLFFGFVIALLFWIGSRFADVSDAQSQARDSLAREPQHFSSATFGVLFLTLAAGAGGDQLWRITSATETIDEPRFVAGIGGWVGPAVASFAWRPEFVKSGHASGVRYVSRQGEIFVYARTFARMSTQMNEALTASLIPEPFTDFHLDERGVFANADGPLVAATVVTDSDGLRWLVWRWYQAGGVLVRSGLSAKFNELRSWIAHRRPTATVVCAVAPLDGSKSEVQTAQMLADFVSVHEWRMLAHAE